MNKKDKFLFVDIDGVLNNDTYCELWHKYRLSNYRSFFKFGVLDPHNIIVLKELVTQRLPEINIVISSDWRYQQASLEELKKVFVQFEVPLWVDVTPISDDWDTRNIREKEIKQYMTEHGIEINQIAILDDINFFKDLSDRFVKTYYRDGLTHQDVEKIVKLFGKQEK